LESKHFSFSAYILDNNKELVEVLDCVLIFNWTFLNGAHFKGANGREVGFASIFVFTT